LGSESTRSKTAHFITDRSIGPRSNIEYPVFP
jgi:hypothetical protein